MIVDIFTHILPAPYFAAMSEAAPGLADMGKRMRDVALLHDLDARFREMDGIGDYRQIITLPNPPIEEICDAARGAELARIGNDSLAELVERHPDRFPAFAAALSLHDVDSAIDELTRAVEMLGARGVQLFTNVAGNPIDDPKYLPVFAAMAEYDLPVWLHPARTAAMPDFPGEARSRYEMYWCFGWPYETSVIMVRLVYACLFDRFPGLKIITHHLGAMIPYFDGRIALGTETLGSRTSAEDYSGVIAALKRPAMEYFKLYFGDTAMMGSTVGLKCGFDFFGSRQVVFSSDAPFGPIAATIRSIESLGLDPADRANIFSANAARLLRLPLD